MKDKTILIILSLLIGIIIIDTLQAKIYNNRPLIKITEYYDSGNLLKKDKGLFVYTYVFQKDKKVTVYKWEKYSPPEEANLHTNNKSEEIDKMDNVKNIVITINNKKYKATLEDNETVSAFLKILPQEFNMEELNGNEKYIYMDHSLPTKSSNPKYIEAGDIMLYGDNCLVIFYKSFETTYQYTKIGHIDNLTNLGNGNITAKFAQ